MNLLEDALILNLIYLIMQQKNLKIAAGLIRLI